MAEDPKAGSGINYQVDNFNSRKKAQRANELKKAKDKLEQIRSKSTVKRFVKKEIKPEPIISLKTKKAQTLTTSADKPKEIIQSKKMSTGSASQLSKQSKLKNLMDKAVYAANKLKKK